MTVDPSGSTNGEDPGALETELTSHLAHASPEVRQRILEWARQLIDLSRRNRLLAYRPTKRTTLVLQDPAPDVIAERLLDGGSWAIYQPLPPAEAVHGPRDLTGSLSLHPRKGSEVVSTLADPVELGKSLDAIGRRAKAEFDDRGNHTLHLVWGLLHWADPGSEIEWTSPLVLIPIELARESRTSRYELKPTDDDPALNPALRVKLENDFGIILSDADFEEMSLPAILDAVTTQIAPDLPRGWRIEPHVAIGMFSFAKEPMYRDLVQNADQIQAHPGVQSLALGSPVGGLLPTISVDVPTEAQLDFVQQPGQSYSVLDADSSQRLAIEAAIRGQSFVLHGPPGTGKSQTITNIIGELVSRGKSVLFVSQKAAALDVVANRLGAVDLRDLVLELHSAKASRAEVARELARTLDEQQEYHDGAFPSAARTMTDARSLLNDYAAALHEVREPLGLSTYDALAEIEHRITAPALPSGPVDPVVATRSDLGALEAGVARLADAWDPVEAGDAFVWRDAVLRTFNAVERQRVLDILEAGIAATDRVAPLEHELESSLERAASQNPADRAVIQGIGALVRSPCAVPDEWLTTDDLSPVRGLLDHWHEIVARREETAAGLSKSFGHRWEELRSGLASDLDTALNNQSFAPRLAIEDAGPEMVRIAGAAAADAANEIRRAESLVVDLRGVVGIKARGDGLQDVDALLRVARITQQRHRPPSEWLARARAEDAHRFLDDHGPAYEGIQHRRKAILDDYDVAILDLDMEPIASRLERFHGRWWNRLRPSYRADRKLLTSLRHERSVSPALVADSRSIATFRREQQRLSNLDPEARSTLGPYSRGIDTDIPAARAALEAAQLLIDLPHDATDWPTLSAKATFEASYDPAIDRTADELSESLSRALGHLDRIEPVMGSRWLSEIKTVSRTPSVERLGELATAVSALNVLVDEAAPLRVTEIGSLAQLVSECRQRSLIAVVDLDIAGSEAILRSTLHTGWAGLDTNWDALREGLRWSEELRRYYGGATLSSGLVQRIRSGEARALPWDAYGGALGIYEAKASLAADLFALPRRPIMAAELTGSLASARARYVGLVDRIEQLSTWVRFLAAADVLEALGWKEFVASAVDRNSIRTDLVPSATRAWYSAWVDAIVVGDERLQGFTLEEHERTITAFADADKKLIRLARERVLRGYEEKKPASVTMQGGEQALIRREAAKRRRHIPVRKLLGEIPTVLPRLKPCLMMSPLSVSHFLPANLSFDTVVFDEASQVPPEDAINCIYRAKQLIVAGDPKQLPPTDFFQLAAAIESETELETQVDDFESILDLAQASGYPLRPLRWHYRSRHDSLIAFSNHFIYANSLVTFPPPHRNGDDLGVQFAYVANGVFDRGRSARNVVEAREVVRLLARQLRDEPDLSVGVVAFSVAQQDSIQDEWDRKLREEPGLEGLSQGDRLNALFIKNLETVQGDERDVIIFSIGYGRDADGRLLMNFGPLNREGGARRLNVAVTRARRKVIVVSSIRADDFRRSETVAMPEQAVRGPELLRAYLDYAEHGTLPVSELGPASRGDFESPFEMDVASAIQSLGYEVVPQVGVSTYRVDLGVVSKVRPSRFALGVECDGASYHSAKTARDRDRLREQVLRDLGWRIHRVWSQDWRDRRASALERIRLSIEAAEDEERSALRQVRSSRGVRATVDAADAGPEARSTLFSDVDLPAERSVAPEPDGRRRHARESIDLTDPLDASRLPWVVPYTIGKFKPYRATYLEFHDAGLVKEHAARIVGLVSDEGPIHVDQVCSRLARAFGLLRVGSRMQAAIDSAIRTAEEQGGVRRRGPFVWPQALKALTTVRVPVPSTPESMRNIDEIPPEEIDVALLRVLETAVHAEDADLRVAVARVFGFNRTGDLIGQVLGARIEQLKKSGKIAPANGGWKLNADLPRLAPRPADDGWRIGDWARHPKRGVGRIVRQEGDLVTLRYGSVDKHVDAKAAHLEPASPPR